MIFIIILLLILLFGFVLLFGAPYLPTKKKQIESALDLLDLEKGQIMYELGCGDGRVLRQAAKRGIVVVGYELNPLLVLIAWLNTYKYRKQVKVVWGNFWKADLTKADGVFVFLLARFMKQLDSKLQKELKNPARLVSFAFTIPGKKFAKQKDGIYLYKY